jgi:hypothetical protein
MEQQKYRAVSLERLVKVAQELEFAVSCDIWTTETKGPVPLDRR